MPGRLGAAGRAIRSTAIKPKAQPGRHRESEGVKVVCVSAKLKCPVWAKLKCPLFEGACGIQYERVPGPARRLQAAGGRRYGDHAAATGGPGTRCAAAARLKATAAERDVGVTLPSAPALFPQA